MEILAIIHTSPFYEMAAILLLAAMAGFMAIRLQQPLLISFIAVGVLTGPDILGLVSNDDTLMKTLSQLGIALLLFMVGLKLDLALIRKLGPTAVTAGLLQIIICTLLGAGLALAMGFGTGEALLIGLALSFSSTIIVVKLLSDTREIDSLYGRMALGILIIQDMAVILATIILSAGTSGDGLISFDWIDIAMIFVKLAGLLVFAGIFIRFIARPLSLVLGKSPELMVIFAIGYAGVAAALCSYVGLSKELGGLIAGITLASTALNNVMSSRLTALRDFLLLFFFVTLGAQISLENIGRTIAPALIFFVFVMTIKPLVIMFITRACGYRPRASVLTGLTLGQISEFSMILIVMALGTGFISPSTVDIVTLVGIMTMGLSTYAILNDNKLYQFAEKHLPFIHWQGEGKSKESAENKAFSAGQDIDIIVYGLGRYGSALAKQFKRQGLQVLAVDFDPDAIKRAREMGIPAIYGDAADPDFPLHLPLDQAKTIVMAFHYHLAGPMHVDDRKTLARSLRNQGYTGHIAATLNYTNIENSRDLAHYGVDIILEPYIDAAYHGAEKIMQTMGLDLGSSP